MRPDNLFLNAVAPAAGERFDMLLNHKNLVIERIISSSVITPQESVQEQDEWVLLLQGEALLQVDGKPVALKAGDHLFLPAGLRHTVERASAGAMWLAVHLHPESSAPPEFAA
jgi:cupin 2 domain-containing protein